MPTDSTRTSESEPILRCLLFHGQVLLRQGLRRLLEDESGIEVVGEAGTAAECVRKLEELQPSIILAGNDSLDFCGEEAKLRIMQTSPQTRIIFISNGEPAESFNTSHFMENNRTTRHTSVQDLVAMMRNTCGVAQPNTPRTLPKNATAAITPFPQKNILTAREREVLKLLAEGKTVRMAATILGVSVKTVDAHKFNLMRKLGIHNKAELVMFAIQKNVVKVPVNF